MITLKELFPAGSVAINGIGGVSLNSSSNLATGLVCAAISNVSTLDLDHIIYGSVTSGFGGTTPTIGSQIQVWIIPCLTDDLAGTVTWPDAFAGITNSILVVSSPGVLQSCGRLGFVVDMDLASSDIYFPVEFSVASLFGGNLPTSYQIYISQNTGKAISSTGQHDWFYQRIKAAA